MGLNINELIKHRIKSVALAIIIGALCVTAFAQPAPFTDPRTQVIPDSEIWQRFNLSAVADVSLAPDDRGSGVLISRCIVLTAGHVPYDETETRRPGKVVTVKVGMTSVGHYIHESKGEVIEVGGWPQFAGRDRRVRNDWAVVRMYNCTDKIKPAKLSRRTINQLIANHDQVTVVGLPGRFQGRYTDDRMIVYAVGYIVGSDQLGGATFNAWASPGQSGGPVYDSQGEVVGLVILSSVRPSSDASTVLIGTEMFYDVITKYVGEPQ